MLLIVTCIAVLILGFLVYSRVAERALRPLRQTTPATSMGDGMDYVPMNRRKNLLIELLNIAGTGPIFGALMGAKWGPIVFIWIIAGTVLGGAVHDYMSGMMSVRNGGKSASFLVHRYLGNRIKYPLQIVFTFLLIMVTATFAKSASDLLSQITGIPPIIWIMVTLLYFMVSTIFPVDKVIGKIYPVFGVLLILMAVVVMGGVLFGGFALPTFCFENLHPNGQEYFPDMFITVACGAISGFHATQAPMVARCLKSEKDGRIVFYGAMIIESVIALIWAAAGLAFFGDTQALADALAAGGASGTVYDISTGVAGPLGGIIAVVGVVVCTITSGDTALRSARMMIGDELYDGNDSFQINLSIAIVLMVPVVLLCNVDFTILWNYFSWINQTLACIMLWTTTVFLLMSARHKAYSLMTALPAMFMTTIVTSFIFHSSLGLSLDYNLSIAAGLVLTFAAQMLYVRQYIRIQNNGGDAPAAPDGS